MQDGYEQRRNHYQVARQQDLQEIMNAQIVQRLIQGRPYRRLGITETRSDGHPSAQLSRSMFAL